MYNLVLKFSNEYLYYRGLSSSSIDDYIHDILQLCSCISTNRTLEGRGTSYEALQHFFKTLEANYSPQTVKRKMVSAKSFMNFLYKSKIIQEDEFRKFKFKVHEKERLPKFIPKKELRLIFSHLIANTQKPDNKNELRICGIIEFLYLTGVRVDELCNIRSENILQDDQIVLIDGKGGKQRAVPIDTSSSNCLNLYTKLFSHEIAKSGYFFITGYFFINKWGERISPQSVRSLVKKTAADAGVEIPITPHMFRHTLATNLLENGVDLRTVQEVLGHSSIKTTEIYTHVTVSRLKEALLKKHPYSVELLN